MDSAGKRVPEVLVAAEADGKRGSGVRVTAEADGRRVAETCSERAAKSFYDDPADWIRSKYLPISSRASTRFRSNSRQVSSYQVRCW